MKKMTSIILVMVMAMSICFLVGCTSSHSPEVEMAVVIGSHANAPDIPLNAETISEAIYESCYTYGSVSFITADGNPKVYFQANIPKPEARGLTKAKKESIANGYCSQLLTELSKAMPQVPEVDTLKAIQQAAKTLSGNSEGVDKVMVIMDSGLSTVGYLDFTKGLLYSDTENIVDALIKAEAVPDLTGISVTWMFNGQTAYPQLELSEKQKHKLEEIWKAILDEGDAKDVYFADDIASYVTEKGYPSVSVVDVEERRIQVTANMENIIEEPIETIVLGNTSVQFIGNKAEFVDYDAASEIIREYAEVLIAHPNNKVYVIGTTASGDKVFCDKLSIERSQAVIQLLEKYGVPESQLIPMGLGFEDPWHLEDLDESGNQIEKNASQNRKVLIVDVNGSDAKKLN